MNTKPKLRQHTYSGRTTVYVQTTSGSWIGSLLRTKEIPGWRFRKSYMGKEHGVGQNWTKKQALEELLKSRKSAQKRKRALKKTLATKCTCCAPKRHKDCSYCGWFASDQVCGVCYEAGIDGKCIPGTARRTCKLCKEKRNKVQDNF